MSILGTLSDTLANARSQQARNQMAGREFNLKMAQESANFYGQRANQTFQNTLKDIQRLGLDSEQLKDNFEYFRSGEFSFTPTELRKVAALQYQKDPRLQRAGSQQDYEDSYIKNFTSSSGFDAAAVGTNKKLGRLGYDAATDSYSPTVITYSPERRQAYEANFTMNGQEERLGDEPVTIPGAAFDQALRTYMNNIQRQAGFDVNTTGTMAALAGTGGDRDPRSAIGKLGTVESFDPNQNIELRRGLAEEVQGTMMGGSPQGQGQGTPPIQGDTQTQTQTPTPVTTPSDTEAVAAGTQLGLINPRTQEPLNEQELARNVKGPDGVNRFVGRVTDNNYIHNNDAIPLGMSPQQFNSYPQSVQQELIKASKAKSDANIAAAYNAQLETIRSGTGRVNPAMLEDAEATLAMRQEQGDRGPTGGGTSYIDSAQRNVDRLKGFQTNNALAAFYSNDILDVLQNHPAYFDQFTQLGAVEFAARYQEDPEFAKNIPSPQQVNRNKIAINQIEKRYKEETGVTITNNSATIPSKGGAKRTTFKDALKFPAPTSSAVDNVAALVFTNVLDDNIGEADLRQYSRKQRMILGMTALGSLPPEERKEMSENMYNMIEFGVLKTRRDMAPETSEIITAVNNAFTQDRAVNRDAQDQLFNTLAVEQNNENMDLQRARLGQSQEQLAFDREKETRTRQSNEEARIRDARDFNRSTINDAVTYVDNTRDLLINLREPGGLLGNVSKGKDIFTALSGQRPAQVKRAIQDKGGEFLQSVNLLAQRIYESPTPQARLQLQGIVDNALKQYMRGQSSHWFFDWWRGEAPPEAGDLTTDVIFLNKDGQPFYDMTQVYNPRTNPNGELPAAIGYYSQGKVQKGTDISPTQLNQLLGADWYALALSTAIQNANKFGAGEGG
tara:strand:- start:1383 stop:4076 length:2694 start_codon:yes stop_codon:yes gene_type:complete